MSTTTTRRRNTDTTAAREAARRTYAARRASKAVAELESQGYLVLSPEEREWMMSHYPGEAEAAVNTLTGAKLLFVGR